MIELNIGGKIFATTFATINREISLLSVLISGGGPESLTKLDKQGRLFVDRDPTHFRWVLNYLRFIAFSVYYVPLISFRDGYLVTIPSKVQDRLELLTEARFYRMESLVAIIVAPQQYQQPHPYIAQQFAAQALAASAAMQAAQVAQNQTQAALLLEGKPSFMNVRPSTRGLFYLTDVSWASLFPERPTLGTVGVNFEDSSDEIVFWSLVVTIQLDPTGAQIIPSLISQEELCRTKLEVGLSAKAIVDLSIDSVETPEQQHIVYTEFWWEPSQSEYPQLYGRFYRNDVQHSGPMDFLRTEPE
eukprot:TRINITY_DN5085_c0_g1_i10.p1 TRINITY_DN5085_c0_g1~~TRINITY_DN5085_c0_g1_i10.p1  ORF type:complete len:302 (-),score=62.63 TRINITY_DN5085_c0_g1_i10:267-1172(-)